MSPDPTKPIVVRSDVHSEVARSSGLLALVRVALMLVLWVCGFVGFLVAPLLVLAVAGILGVTWIAFRNRGRGNHRALEAGKPAPSAHRFGASFPGHADASGDAA
jgi:hypothetical protein